MGWPALLYLHQRGHKGIRTFFDSTHPSWWTQEQEKCPQRKVLHQKQCVWWSREEWGVEKEKDGTDVSCALHLFGRQVYMRLYVIFECHSLSNVKAFCKVEKIRKCYIVLVTNTRDDNCRFWKALILIYHPFYVFFFSCWAKVARLCLIFTLELQTMLLNNWLFFFYLSPFVGCIIKAILHAFNRHRPLRPSPQASLKTCFIIYYIIHFISDDMPAKVCILKNK